MLCDVVRRRRRRRWAHAPVIHAASHFDQKKRVAWVPISMHTCGSFFYNYGAPLGGPSGRRSSAIITQCFSISTYLLLSLTLLASCNMDLGNFPLDSQSCCLKFGSCKYMCYRPCITCK